MQSFRLNEGVRRCAEILASRDRAGVGITVALNDAETGFGEGKVGFVALVGRPNVGKSTLLNRILGYRISAVSRHPNTTRRRWMGIISDEGSQLVLVDTPGVHKAINRMQRVMAHTIVQESENSDAVICLCDPTRAFGDEDRRAAEIAKSASKPVLLAVNKVDVAKRSAIDETVDAYRAFVGEAPIFEISARTGQGIPDMLQRAKELMPQGPFLFPKDQLTDAIEREIASELIREAATEQLRQELPQSLSISIDQWSERGSKAVIQASLIVERESQKAIVIGKGGRLVESIQKQAREKLMEMHEGFVDLRLRVKVVPDWQNRRAFLHEQGIVDGD